MSGRYSLVGLLIFATFSTCGAAIVPLDATYSANVGENVTFPWAYDNEGSMFTVSWTYKSPASLTKSIMSQSQGSSAVPLNNYDVEHNGNGNITLKSVSVNDTGIYYCTVTYDVPSGNSPATGTATLAVNASPTPEPEPGCKWFGSSMEKSICIVILIVIIIFCILVIPCVTGSVWGGCMLNGHGRCCSDEGRTFPNWYYKCEESTWGLIFPVAFGIWVAKKCCGNEADKSNRTSSEYKPDEETRNSSL